VNDSYPVLSNPAELPRRVLVFAPHADDDVLGCGGLLALLARQGARVRVVVLTDGARGGEGADLVARREDEARAAGRALGVEDYAFWRLPDQGLGGVFELVERLRREIEGAGAELLLAPWALEHHPDHRAAAHACAAACARAPELRVLLYGVDAAVTANVLYDVGAVWDAQRAALRCFASQNGRKDLVAQAEAAGRARTATLDDPRVERLEGFVALAGRELLAWTRRAETLRVPHAERAPGPRTTAVVSTWNKKDDLCANLDALRAQTRPFDDIVVVDNASRDGTADLVRAQYPEVRLIVMPHERYGACETFNIGFASSRTELTAILDDDIVMPPDWLEKAVARLVAEPETTGVVSTQVTEPGMPAGYLTSARHNQERYLSTFRGCASLARTEVLRRAGFYDERLFIYGNERDLTCRMLNLGYRVLQYPGCGVFHKTPFGIKMGKRSLYYHARNAWLSMLKYAPLGDLVRLPWLVLTRVVLRGSKKEAAGEVADATGTIGIGRSLRETPGATWIVFKAACSVLANLPYCLKHRAPVRHPDFDLPLS